MTRGFYYLLKHERIQTKLDELCESLETFENADDIKKVVQILSKIITAYAEKTLNLRNWSAGNQKLKKLSYERNCESLKKQFTRLAKLLKKVSMDPYVLGQCFIVI